ncbi:unnamed protein product [Rhodiola kirilowii]
MYQQNSSSGKRFEGRSSGVGSKMKISLDSYISFVESGDKSDYKVDFINQVIHSHGFRRTYRTPKKELVEAVESIKMMNLSRSTLRENISPGPFISHDKMNADVKCLDWFECSNCRVTSVQNMNNEAPPSKDLVVYKGEDVPIQPKRKSSCKLPAMHSSPAKTKKRTTGRRSDDSVCVLSLNKSLSDEFVANLV